ncbi:MAG: cell division protein FtsZ [Alphaproteobacteria bacterium]|nr:cell division protein FtsZ [Alphaproteobacteria bacterium]
MTINLNIPDNVILKPRITVFGVGGAGGNAVNNMINSNLEGAEFIVANTDAQALEFSKASTRVQLGENITRGLGAGASPDVGRASAEESSAVIDKLLDGSNMVFITAGMGGGTGTGAAPVVANLARNKGILTVGVVTKPFHFEGAHRMRLAEQGLIEMQKYVDTLIVIPNQNLFRVANERTTFADAFKMADDVLHAGVRGVTDLITMPGLINLDFADIVTIMSKMGKAMMGTGEASGDNRSILAAEAAISNPLLDQTSMKGARGVLINITGGPDMTLFEVDEAASRIRDEVDSDANIIYGSTFNPNLTGQIRITVVATGIDHPEDRRTSLNVERKIDTAPVKETVKVTVETVTVEEVPVQKAQHDNFAVELEKEVESLIAEDENVEIRELEEELVGASNFRPQVKHESFTQTTNPSLDNFMANYKREIQTEQQYKQQAEPVKNKGLFGRVASSLFGSNEQSKKDAHVEVSVDEGNLDIPAFLRRKQK